MGAEAQSVPAAAKLFNQANDILGYRRTSPPLPIEYLHFFLFSHLQLFFEVHDFFSSKREI
jgi:hypothetical protein